MGYLEAVVAGFEGRTALVTGSAVGIGAAVARAMAEAGARVVLVDRNAEGLARTVDLITKEGGVCLPITLDLTTVDGPDSARALVVSPAIEAFGSLEILMHVAGDTHPPRPFEQVTPEDLDYVMAVNVRAPFFISQAALPYLRPKGVIVFVASLTAHMGVMNTTGLTMSKGALVALGRALAVELGGSGVRVNVLSPGGVDTPGNERFWTDEFRATLTARTPAGRVAVADDLVGPLLFLASDAARHVYGQTLVVDGGYLASGDAMPGMKPGPEDSHG